MYGIFTHIWLIFMVDMGKYAVRPMDPMQTSHANKWVFFIYFKRLRIDLVICLVQRLAEDFLNSNIMWTLTTEQHSSGCGFST